MRSLTHVRIGTSLATPRTHSAEAAYSPASTAGCAGSHTARWLLLIGVLALAATCKADGVEGVLIPETTRLAAPLTLGVEAPATQRAPWGTTKKLIAFAILGQVLDLVSTDVVLAQGGQELNPLMKRREVRYGVKGLFILSTFGLHALPAWQADGVAKTIGWTGFIPGLANTVQLLAVRR